MVQEYNLDRVGKKMPFSMPDGFFDQIQANVLAEVKSHRKAKLVRLYAAIASIAACVCLVVLMGRSLFSVESKQPQHSVESVASVDKAYDNLSEDEQQELNATYANDVYLCME